MLAMQSVRCNVDSSGVRKSKDSKDKNKNDNDDTNSACNKGTVTTYLTLFLLSSSCRQRIRGLRWTARPLQTGSNRNVMPSDQIQQKGTTAHVQRFQTGI